MRKACLLFSPICILCSDTLSNMLISVLIITLTIVSHIDCQSVSPKCVFPRSLTNDCAEAAPVNSTHQLTELYPWHVALYRLQLSAENAVPINVCGGTLISASVMLTAAHCLAEDADGSLKNISEYLVAAGNEFRGIDDERDMKNRQIRKIQRVVLPSVYRGHESGFVGDIAIVELDQAMVISNFVRPACLSETPASPALLKGETVGWGLTVASRDPNTKLSHIDVPHVDLTTCRFEVDTHFHPYLTEDKFCGSFSEGSSICSTDNGGGILHTEKHSNGKSRWHLDGIASVGLISGGNCESKQYSAFTKIHNYYALICESVVKTL